LKQQIINKALWNENTELEFNISNNTQCSSFLDLDKHVIYYPEVRVVDKQKLKAYRLDSLIENYEENILFSDPQFINIDTQGSELKIIEGMGRYIGIRSLVAIYVEVNKENLYKNVPQVGELDSYLRPHNFQRIITKWTSEGWGDALYIRAKE
jgi:FkbM family methyltransferase